MSTPYIYCRDRRRYSSVLYISNYDHCCTYRDQNFQLIRYITRSSTNLLTFPCVSVRIYLPIHGWRTYRSGPSELFDRYYSPRYLLRSSPLPLCIINRSCIRYFCWVSSLIPTIYWFNYKPRMTKNSFYCDVYRS